MAAQLTPEQIEDQNIFSEFLNVPRNHRKKRARQGLTLFSQFREDHMLKVEDLMESFEETMKSTNSFRSVVDRARQESQDVDLELVQHALSQFVVENPQTRSVLRIPPLVTRFPRTILRHRASKFGPDAAAVTQGKIQDGTISTAPKVAVPAQVGSAQEKLNWWKEDPSLNEHHEHYHMVFPWISRRRRNKDRQGELFIYMHKQMLARYDAERRALGIPRVQAIGSFDDPLEGYTPHKELRDETANVANAPFTTRSQGSKIPPDGVRQLEGWRNAIREATRTGRYRTVEGRTMDLTPDALGAIIERSTPAVNQGDINLYGNIHNSGHGYIDELSVNAGGVMGSTRTACRDPVFWRWHKLIDGLYSEWTDKFSPVDFKEAPPVQVNGVFLEDKPALDKREPSASSDRYVSYAQRTYGGAKFTETNIPTATNELQTTIKQRVFSWPEDSHKPETINYVYPKEWVYFIRLTNTSNKTALVTVRIFIVPKDYADDRKAWIEMDKFSSEVGPNAKTVIARSVDDAAVIRKPPLKTGEQMDSIMTGFKNDVDAYCDCGWPYHLVLPRGTSEGLPYKMVTLVTDGNADQQIRQPSKCGSVSFCGAGGEQFPDRRTMGYPFHVPFKREGDKESHAATFANVPSVFLRDFTIREVKAL